MSSYYNNYNNRNYKNNQRKKKNSKTSSIISTVLIIAAILAVFGGLAVLMKRDTQTNTSSIQSTTDNQSSNDVVYTPIVSDLMIYVDDYGYQYLGNSQSIPHIVAIDKTGVNGVRSLSTEYEGNAFIATVPAGYTHIVLYGDDNSSNDYPISEEFQLDTTGNNYLTLATGEWTTYIPEE